MLTYECNKCGITFTLDSEYLVVDKFQVCLCGGLAYEKDAK